MTPAEMAALYARAFPDRRGWSAAEIQNLLDRPSTLCACAPQGFALIQCLPPEAEILTLLIDPADQRQGAGRKLLTAVLAACMANGAETVLLEVEDQNTPARALYRSAGFAEVSRRTAYFRHADGPARDAIVMTLSLDARETGRLAEN